MFLQQYSYQKMSVYLFIFVKVQVKAGIKNNSRNNFQVTLKKKSHIVIRQNIMDILVSHFTIVWQLIAQPLAFEFRIEIFSVC